MPTDWGEGNFPGGGPDAALVESLIRRGHIVDSQVSRAGYSIPMLVKMTQKCCNLLKTINKYSFKAMIGMIDFRNNMK